MAFYVLHPLAAMEHAFDPLHLPLQLFHFTLHIFNFPLHTRKGFLAVLAVSES